MKLRRLRRWAHKATENALEIARLGRLGAEQHALYEVKDKTPHYRLRHYLPPDQTPRQSPPSPIEPGVAQPGTAMPYRSAPLLLVPPLMLTAEIYDVSPELSAVSLLVQHGIDVWVVDFGAPEREQGGMDRTLDDHLRAVVRAARRVRELSGMPVHLGGYSQGGMFAYQAAAYLRSEGLASVITFGSPVDIHKTVPAVYSDITRRLIQGVRPLVELPLRHIDGLPAILTSTGFKLLMPRKELQQLARFVSQLHDRQALEKQQTRRRFLGGGGFVAWPGPALEQFFDQFIVHNRMLAGGIVLDGRTLALADIQCPILYFVGHRDDVARPATVRAIRKAAPQAETYEQWVRAGHFGLVVGSSSLAHTWPAVADWVRWRAGEGPRPDHIQLLGEPPETSAPRDTGRTVSHPVSESIAPRAPEDDPAQMLPWQWLQDELVGAARERWRRLGHAVRDAGDTVHDLRWQLPRLTQLVSMTGDSRISASLVLREQARSIGDKPFFLYQGRAFSYAEADTRIDHVVRGLLACGLRRGDAVGVLMGGRPSLLSLVTALSRLGAVAVLFDTRLQGDELRQALQQEPCRAVIGDPEHAEALQAAFDGEVLVLGGGPRRQLVGEVIDMEAIDTSTVALPPDFEPDPGRAREPAMVFIRGVRANALKVSRISHGRWAFSAIGVASAATLSPADTVYCGWGLPLSHPTSMMVAMGGALVGGARLALPHGHHAGFSATEFWQQVRRYGATVAFYAGEIPRMLLTAAPAADDRDHPLRLLAGSGMRADLWRDLQERFGIGVMEFYASTERNLVLANASGEKRGALGQPLPGSSELALARYDFERDAFVTQQTRWQRCRTGEPGVALVRANPSAAAPHARRNVFAVGDAWFVSGDVLRRDADGDYWFVDRLKHMVRTPGGMLATPPIEDALYRLSGIRLAVAYGEMARTEAHHQVPVAALVSDEPLDPARVTEVLAELPGAQRPRWVRRVAALPMTDSHRPLKQLLGGAPPDEILQALRYDSDTERYRGDSLNG